MHSVVCLWQLLFVHVLQLWSIICRERINNFFLIDKDMHVTFLFCKQHSGQTLFQNIIPISEVGWHIQSYLPQPSSTVLYFSGPCSPSHSFPPLSSSVVFQSPPTLSMCHTHFSWIFTPIHGVFRLKLQNCTLKFWLLWTVLFYFPNLNKQWRTDDDDALLMDVLHNCAPPCCNTVASCLMFACSPLLKCPFNALHWNVYQLLVVQAGRIIMFLQGITLAIIPEGVKLGGWPALTPCCFQHPMCTKENMANSCVYLLQQIKHAIDEGR